MTGQVRGPAASGISFNSIPSGTYLVTILPLLESAVPLSRVTGSSAIHTQRVVVTMETGQASNYYNYCSKFISVCNFSIKDELL